MSSQYDAYEGRTEDDEIASLQQLINEIEEREHFEQDDSKHVNEYLRPNPCPKIVTDPEMRAVIEGLEARKREIRATQNHRFRFFKPASKQPRVAKAWSDATPPTPKV